MPEDSSTDSDLEREQVAISQLELEPVSSYESTKDYYTEQANSFIGGSAVISRANSRNRRGSHHSLFEEEEEDGSIEDTSGELSSGEIDETPSHKIFTFSLPFGGKNLLPVSPLSSLKALLSNDQTINDVATAEHTDDKKVVKLNREDIKLKLKRQDSITSIEERFLFANNKGVENVRSKAVKHVFKPEAILNALKSFSNTNPNAVTKDGYSISRMEKIWDELEGDIVILGGYRGSILRNAITKKRVWIPIKAGFNMTKINLLLGPNETDEINASKTIIPDGMLTHLGPVDVAKRLIKRLDMNPKIHIEDFGYDWRLSIDLTASQLKDKLQELYDKQKIKKGTYVIAHSMGGLLAHKVLQDFTHLIRGIIYVGAPSQCPNILGPLRFGDEVILNKSILNAESNFFMRSSFYFLPIDGRCFINKRTYERYDLDYFNPEVWKEYCLSPLVNPEREKDEENDQIKENNKHSLLSPVKMIKSSSNLLKEETELEFQTSFEDSYEYLKRILAKTKASFHAEFRI